VDAVVTIHPFYVLMKSDLKSGCKNYPEEKEISYGMLIIQQNLVSMLNYKLTEF
jgi:hypothetical protein